MHTLPSRSSLLVHGAISTMIVGGMLSACSHTPSDPTPSPIFSQRVRPILETNCLHCHDGRSPSGDLDLRNRELAFRDSPNGPFFVPGDPEASKVFRVVKLGDDIPGAMPPTGHSLSHSEIEALREWIASGAYWPLGEAGQLSASGDTPRSS